MRSRASLSFSDVENARGVLALVDLEPEGPAREKALPVAALAEARARTEEKARSVRQAVLLVAALMLAVALAVLGKRMLF